MPIVLISYISYYINISTAGRFRLFIVILFKSYVCFFYHFNRVIEMAARPLSCCTYHNQERNQGKLKGLSGYSPSPLRLWIAIVIGNRIFFKSEKTSNSKTLFVLFFEEIISFFCEILLSTIDIKIRRN